MAAAEKGGPRLSEKDDKPERDLLSLLIRANMDADLPENQRLSDDDVLARTYSPTQKPDTSLDLLISSEVPTFLVAGHETTRLAIGHCPRNGPPSDCF
jgi:cytochrome P450